MKIQPPSLCKMRAEPQQKRKLKKWVGGVGVVTKQRYNFFCVRNQEEFIANKEVFLP